MINKRTAVSAAALLAMMFPLSACGTSDSSSSPSSGAGTVPPGSAAAQPADPAIKVPERFAAGIKVASGVFPPMTMLSPTGEFSGLDYDLGQAIGGKLGVPVTFHEQDFDSIIPSLQSGKHTIIINGMNDTAARQKTLDFVDYFHGGMSIVVKKGNPEGITTVLDLCGKTVAVAKATVQADLMRAESAKCAGIQKAPITITELPAENDALLAVRSGRAVADVFDSAPAQYTQSTAGDGALFEVVKDTKYPNGYSPVFTGIGILKKDHDLALAVQASLQSLIDDGTYAALLTKYGLSSYAVPSAQLNQGT